MKRKLFISVLSPICAICCVAGFAACKPDQSNPGDTGGKKPPLYFDEPTTTALEYKLSDDQQSYIVTGIGEVTTPEIVIPSTYNSLPVVGIGDNAFSTEALEITSVTIPTSVTYLGDYVFTACSTLTDITIPNSVKSMGIAVFDGCTGLRNVKLSENLEVIKTSTFKRCSALLSIQIPDSVTAIEANAFENCIKLAQVTMGSKVTSIAERSFYNCSQLQNITIGSSVKSIGNEAFLNCSSLITVVVPDSVDSIGWSAFKGCDSIVNLTIPFVGKERPADINLNLDPKNNEEDRYTIYDDRDLDAKKGILAHKTEDGTAIDVTYFGYIFGSANSETEQSVNGSVIPKSIKNVTVTGGYILCATSMAYLRSLETLTLKNIYYIGITAFAYAENIKDIYIDKTVKYIGDDILAYSDILNRTIKVHYLGNINEWNEIYIMPKKQDSFQPFWVDNTTISYEGN